MAKCTKSDKMFTEGMQEGLQKGIIIGRTELTRELEAKQRQVNQQVFHLEGAAMLIKMLHEQLRLAGVPEYISRRP